MRTHCHIIEHLVAAAKARLEKLQRRRRRRRADDEEDWRGGEGNILNIPEPIIGSKKNLVKGRDPHEETQAHSHRFTTLDHHSGSCCDRHSSVANTEDFTIILVSFYGFARTPFCSGHGHVVGRVSFGDYGMVGQQTQHSTLSQQSPQDQEVSSFLV